MKIVDLSQPLYDACPNCPAHPAVRVAVISEHTDGGAESWHMEQMTMASHTGSHVDAPLHKVKGGKSIDDFSLSVWTGRAVIVDFRGIAARGAITAGMLAGKISGEVTGAWVLLVTGWGDKRAATREWLQDAPVLAADGAAWLVAQGARGVGIDHFSVGDAQTHAVLLGAAAPVLIVEELHFPPEVIGVTGGEFQAFPIHFKAHSGAPCRPVLFLP